MNQTKQPETGPAEPWPVWCERPGAMDDICDAVLTGTTLSAWAQERSFSYYTVLRWVRADAGRTNQYRELADFRIDRLADEIIALGDDSSQDLCTDAKGKTAFNTAHFRRQGRQIDTRKCILRQLTTARRLAKDEKPQWSYEEEILKLGNDDTPYDPTGLIAATKPSYNPGPPPLSRPAPSSQSTIHHPLEGEAPNSVTAAAGHVVGRDSVEPHLLALPARAERVSPEGVNPEVRNQPEAVTHHASRTTFSHHASRTTSPDISSPPTNNEQPSTNNKQKITGEPTFPSYRAYLRAIWESGWVEGTPLPFVYRPTPEAPDPKASQGEGASQSTIAAPPPLPNPNPPPASQPAIGGRLTDVPAQAGSGSDTLDSVTQHASRTTSPEVPSPTTPAEQPTTNNPQRTTDQSAIEPPTKQTPKATIGGVIPKLDWYKFLGIRQLSAFLTLFILFFVTATANLHASIHSLSVPIDTKTKKRSQCPMVPIEAPFVSISVNSWLSPRPEFNSPRATSHEPHTNPSEQYRHSRDAPTFPLNTEH